MRIVVLPVALLAFASASQAQESGWKNLEQLKPGEKIEIVLKSKAKHRGTFAMLADDAITLKTAGGESGYRKDEVARISRLGPARRGRAALIGLAIGAAAGAVIGVAGGDSCDPSISFCIDIISKKAAAAILGAAGGGVGAGVGAAVAQPHRDMLYRAP